MRTLQHSELMCHSALISDAAKAGVELETFPVTAADIGHYIQA